MMVNDWLIDFGTSQQTSYIKDIKDCIWAISFNCMYFLQYWLQLVHLMVRVIKALWTCFISNGKNKTPCQSVITLYICWIQINYKCANTNTNVLCLFFKLFTKMSYALCDIIYMYFKVLFSVKLTLMPHTLRTYFDPNNHDARKKGNKMK